MFTRVLVFETRSLCFSRYITQIQPEQARQQWLFIAPPKVGDPTAPPDYDVDNVVDGNVVPGPLDNVYWCQSENAGWSFPIVTVPLFHQDWFYTFRHGVVSS